MNPRLLKSSNSARELEKLGNLSARLGLCENMLELDNMESCARIPESLCGFPDSSLNRGWEEKEFLLDVDDLSDEVWLLLEKSLDCDISEALELLERSDIEDLPDSLEVLDKFDMSDSFERPDMVEAIESVDLCDMRE